jgi:transcriptional regulator with XRE-family HTH domain
MRPEWLWDKDISIEEIQLILKDPQNERFVHVAALLLSRNNVPKDVFDMYLDKLVFVRHWTRIKRQMRRDTWSNPRIVFWQAVYKKLANEFKEKGIKVFERKSEKEFNYLSQEIGQYIKNIRLLEGLTQEDIAIKLDISQQLISRIENGQENLSLATFEKISRALGQKIKLHVHFAQGSYIENLRTTLPEQESSYQFSPVMLSTNATHSIISFSKTEGTNPKI